MERMLLEMIRSELGDVPVDAENLDGRLNDVSASRLLECCEALARYVSVPIPVLVVTVGQLAVRYFDAKQYEDAIWFYHHLLFKGSKCSVSILHIHIFDRASPSLRV
jgi:hypothetical protein